MKEFDYDIVKIRDTKDEVLKNELQTQGRAGWELVSVLHGEFDGALCWVMFFKREKHPHHPFAGPASAE